MKSKITILATATLFILCCKTDICLAQWQGCNSFNIVTEPGHLDCLKKFENDQFTFMYHPLWKPSKFNSATNTLFQVESESTVKVGDSYKTRTSEFNNSFPLFDKYKYEHFRLNLSINHDMSFEAKLAEFKKWNKNENPKMFDFVNNSGKKGKIITLNYLHEGTGIWKYELYAIIATDVKDSYLYCMMDFLCHPIGNVASGVQATDEAAFRQWATAYLETFVSK